MPGVPTDAEQRARTNAKILQRRGDGTDDDSRTEPGVQPPMQLKQELARTAAAATGQLAESTQLGAPAASSSALAAETALIEQQAVLLAQLTALEAKLAAVRAGKAD
jgi:hypothetical protein